MPSLYAWDVHDDKGIYSKTIVIVALSCKNFSLELELKFPKNVFSEKNLEISSSTSKSLSLDKWHNILMRSIFDSYWCPGSPFLTWARWKNKSISPFPCDVEAFNILTYR